MKQVIRQLAPGESVPTSEPRRYKASHGYVRLRWKVGLLTYVETYEHRVDGDRVTTAEHVHHENRVRDDNRSENLVPVTAREHKLVEHGSQYAEDAVRLYLDGFSLPQVAEQLGIGSPHVYRMLRARGVSRRKGSDYYPRLDDEQILDWYADGLSQAEMARRSGRSRDYVGTRLDGLGLRRRCVGRQRSNE